MNLDFNLEKHSRFNSRCSAIIFNKDKTKVLIFNMEGNSYYMLPGGRIEFNESSKDAIKREILEETGFDLEYELISIQENFVKKGDTNIMQYSFCYKSIYDGEIKDSFKCLDNDSQTFYWVDINNLDNYYLVPSSSLNLIKEDSSSIKHIIERVD